MINLKLFKDITKKQGIDLIRFGIIKTFEKCQFIEEEFQDNIYVVIQGSVEVILERMMEGEMVEYIIASKYDGSYFGDIDQLQQLFPVDYKKLTNFYQSYKLANKREKIEDIIPGFGRLKAKVVLFIEDS